MTWLLENLPAPGDDNWEHLIDILNVGILGKNVRRLAQGLPRPDNHILSETTWRVLSGQKIWPLCEETAFELVKHYQAMLEAELG